MKNLFFLGALLSTLMITGCTVTPNKAENSIAMEKIAKIYGVKDTTLRDYPF